MRRIALLLCSLALVALAVPGGARVLNTGVDTNNQVAVQPLIPLPGQTCHVLWWGPVSGNEVNRLGSLGLSITVSVNPADLTAANLANYDVLVVAYLGPGVIGFAQPVIDAYVASGGGMLVHQPNIQGVIDYAPTGFSVNILNPAWCNYPTDYAGTIINGSHPVTLGMTNADLSGDFDLVGGLGAGYTLLAVNAICGDPAVAAGSYAAGRVVFEAGNADPIAFDPGSDAWWLNVFGWLCTGQPTPAHHTTWGSLKAIYR